MTVRNDSSYAAEKLSAAYDLMATLTVSAEKRLAGALSEVMLLDGHEGQLTERGRDLFGQLKHETESSGSFAEIAREMGESQRERVGQLIRALFHDTLAHYHGVS
jgi:hypothetical protein